MRLSSRNNRQRSVLSLISSTNRRKVISFMIGDGERRESLLTFVYNHGNVALRDAESMGVSVEMLGRMASKGWLTVRHDDRWGDVWIITEAGKRQVPPIWRDAIEGTRANLKSLMGN